jgi:hypothetical protein
MITLLCRVFAKKISGSTVAIISELCIRTSYRGLILLTLKQFADVGLQHCKPTFARGLQSLIHYMFAYYLQ